MISRGLAAVAPLLLIPITLNYLGDQVYGIWMVVVSLTSMALWADLGLGNGLLTKLASCHATGDRQLAGRYVSAAYAALASTAFVLLGLLWIASLLVPWPAFFDATDHNLAAPAQAISVICFSAFIINMPLALVHRVQYAHQAVTRSNIWQAVGSILSVGLAAGAVHLVLDPVAVVAAASSGPIVANIANSVLSYSTAESDIAPQLRRVDRAIAGTLFRLGGKFFALSVVTATALNMDNLIIAHALGLRAVTEYSIPARVFGTLGLIVTLVNLPLWPANGEALARGDYQWVRKTTAQMTAVSATAIVIPATALIIFADRGLALWIGPAFDSSLLLLVGLATWWLLLATTTPRFMVQNAAGLIRPQFYGWCIFFVVSIPLKWFAAKTLGVAGVAFAGGTAYLLIVIPAATFGYRKALSSGRSRKESTR